MISRIAGRTLIGWRQGAGPQPVEQVPVAGEGLGHAARIGDLDAGTISPSRAKLMAIRWSS